MKFSAAPCLTAIGLVVSVLPTTKHFLVGASFSTVPVENCQELDVLTKAECDEYCGDEGTGYWEAVIGSNQWVNDLLVGASCSCGGNEQIDPDNVTKRCQSDVNVVVEDCYSLDPSNNAGNLTQVRNKPECDIFCGDVGRYLGEISGNYFLGLTCSCPASDVGPVTQQCHGDYTVTSCSSVGQTNCTGGDDVNCVDYCSDLVGMTSAVTCDTPGDGSTEVNCGCDPLNSETTRTFCEDFSGGFTTTTGLPTTMITMMVGMTTMLIATTTMYW